MKYSSNCLLHVDINIKC